MQDNVTGGFFAKSDPEEAEVPPECSEACPHRKEAAVHYHCKWVSLPSYLLTYIIQIIVRPLRPCPHE